MKQYQKKKNYKNKLEYSYYNRFLTYIKWSITKYPFKSSNKLALDLFYKFKDTIILKESWFIYEYEILVKNKNNYNSLLKKVIEIYIQTAKDILKDYNNKKNNNSCNSEKYYYYKNYKFRKNDLNKIKEAIELFNDIYFQEKIELFYNDKYKIKYYIEIYKDRLKKDNYIITNLYKKWFNINIVKEAIEHYNSENWINKFKSIVDNEFHIYERNKLKEKILKLYIDGWYNKIYEKLISNKEEKKAIDNILNEIFNESYDQIYNKIKEKILKFVFTKKLSLDNYKDILKIKNKFNYYKYDLINDIINEIKDNNYNL